MLENVNKVFWDAALISVGAFAIAAEKLGEVGEVCVQKGGEAIEKGKIVSEELRRKGEQLAQEHQERSANEALERMTAEERNALRKKLDELDEREAEAKRIAEIRLLESAPQQSDTQE